jgi:hypothetical protein
MTVSTEPTSFSKITSREIRLESQPSGMPTAANFSTDRVELGPLQDQQVPAADRRRTRSSIYCYVDRTLPRWRFHSRNAGGISSVHASEGRCVSLGNRRLFPISLKCSQR